MFVAANPDEVLRWVLVGLVIALAAVIPPLIVWELAARQGSDEGVTSALFILLTFLFTTVGIKITRGDKE